MLILFEKFTVVLMEKHRPSINGTKERNITSAVGISKRPGSILSYSIEESERLSTIYKTRIVFASLVDPSVYTIKLATSIISTKTDTKNHKHIYLYSN